MEEKKKWKEKIWQILACVLLVICIWQNVVIKNQMDDMNSNLQNRISELRYEIDNISMNVSNTLEKEASMISFSEYFIEEVNVEERTANLVCKLLPKEYSEQNTQLSFVYDGEEYPAEFIEGSYKAIISVSIFEDAHIESVIMRDGDTVRTENLDWYVSPRYEYLPLVYADFGNSSSWQKGEGRIVWKVTGDVNVWIDQKNNSGVPEEAYFYAKLDDEIVDKMHVSNGTHFSIDKTYEIPYGSTLTLYVEVIDEFGLCYRPILARVIATEDGALTYGEDEMYWRGSAGNIFDENGNLLYSEYLPIE